MKLTRHLASSALLLCMSLSVLANNVPDVDGSIKFIVSNSTVPVVDANYSYKNFSFRDLKVVSRNNDTVNTFSPNTSGPYPGKIRTTGKLGVFVERNLNTLCDVSLHTVLFSYENHPRIFSGDGTPSVKSESSKYVCYASLSGKNTVEINVLPLS